MVKDYGYLFAFYHKPLQTFMLIISIVFPITLVDSLRSSRGPSINNTFAHNLLNYLGFTETENDKLGRVTSVFLISVLENIPQFIIVVDEIFQLKQTVTFNQAGNPLFAICMTYKAGA